VLPLAGRAFDVLEHLVRHRDRVVGKEELLSAVWPGVVVEENNLNQAVHAIRRALGDSRDAPEFLATVPGRGYRFVARLQDQPLQVPEKLLAPPPAPRADPAGSRSPTVWYRRPYVYVAAGLAALLVAGLSIVGLRRESVPARLPPAAETTRQPLDRPTIAVLPFRTSAHSEASEFLAQSVTDLLRNRLAAFRDLVVIGSASTSGQTDAQLNVRDVGQRLRVRFLLQGSVARTGDQLRIGVQLVDTASGSQLWSTAFDRSVTDVAAIREGIAQRVAGTLQIAVEPAARDASADARINLDAYGLYVQGQRLLSNLRVDDTDKAVALFRRATILDPTFARGYLALGQAQLLAGRMSNMKTIGFLENAQGQSLDSRLSGIKTKGVLGEARQALDRSLELNPALGEAWVERASLNTDPVKAEELYRKGLRLAPNYGVGYMRFSEFLFDQYRKGEAIEMIDRARQIDPLTPSLHLRKAFLLMVSRSDVAGHDRLLREALAINPQFHPALTQLAHSRHEYSGEFVDAIRIVERSIALDPQSEFGRYLAVRIYLDVDDPVAALAVLRDLKQPTEAMVEIAQYQRDRRRAAALSRSRSAERWALGPVAPMAEAIRDDAIVTGDYASALRLLESQYAMGSPEGTGPRMWSRGLGLVFAHTLVLAGERQRGRHLATAIMVQIDGESVGRTQDWFSRERAAAFAILGEDERAIGELEASAKTRKFYRWWYVAELDPLYEHLRGDPRFQVLAEQAKQHRRSQRALLDELRRKGEVLTRAS
jgi:TolB-like protein/DNA-binding winged helix-turn-helix (wHTH) protein/Tfp pilus assembly protein PilF